MADEAFTMRVEGTELGRLVADQSAAGMLDIGAEFALEFRNSAPRSIWPHATGVSRTNFFPQARPDGFDLMNNAGYAKWVERRRKARTGRGYAEDVWLKRGAAIIERAMK